jgi:cell division protein FtsN
MAGKRNTKSQARRNSGGDSTAIPGGIWMLVGLGLGIALFLFLPKFLDGRSANDFFRPKPNAEAQPPAIDATSDKTPIAQDGGDEGTDPASGKTQEQEYDFYTLLSGEETAVSDTELAARARAEEAARQQAADAADPAGTKPATEAKTLADDAKTPPPAIDAPPVADTKTPPKQDDKADQTAAATRDDTRYLLQAGAFQASGDAEALKAKIAFLGLSARVESAQIQGQTVYRVRMGPYGSATELAEAKKKLAGGGLPAMAVKAK